MEIFMPDYTIFLYILFGVSLLVLFIHALRMSAKEKALRLKLFSIKIQCTTNHDDTVQSILELKKDIARIHGETDETVRLVTKKQLDALRALNRKIEENKNSLANFATDIQELVTTLSGSNEHTETQTSILQNMPYNEEMQTDN
jgi:ribosomal protein L29